MSICCNSIRLLSRTRVPAQSTSKTLAPFLYQTSTIQQWTSLPSRPPIAYRTISSRPPKSTHDEDVPFETDASAENTDDLPPAIDELEPPRQTTITGSERAAFEKLYQTFNTQTPPKNDLKRAHEIDQIADEWYEEDEDNDGEGATLDELFDKVLAGAPAPGAVRGRAKKSEDLATLAARILKDEEVVGKKEGKVKDKKLREEEKIAREAEKARVTGLMEKAETDRELWGVLEKEVLGMIKRLDLDAVKQDLAFQTSKSGKNRRAKTKTQPSSDPESPFPTSPTDTPYIPSKPAPSNSKMLFATYPHHLHTAASLLRTRFPTSPLPLSILPTIKSLGRSSYALGASTALYNLLLRTAWHQHSSYDLMDELLSDMDNGGVEFDLDTLSTLDSVLSEFQSVRRGEMGWAVKTVWSMDVFGEGAKRLQKWRDVIGNRLGVTLEQRAREGKVVRKQEQGEDPKYRDMVVPIRRIGIEGGKGLEKERSTRGYAKSSDKVTYEKLDVDDGHGVSIRKVKREFEGGVLAAPELRMKFGKRDGDGDVNAVGEGDRGDGISDSLGELTEASKQYEHERGRR
jgi:hypothetical protein